METSMIKRKSQRRPRPIPSSRPSLKRQIPRLISLFHESEALEGVERDVVEEWVAGMSPVDDRGDEAAMTSALGYQEMMNTIDGKVKTPEHGKRSSNKKRGADTK